MIPSRNPTRIHPTASPTRFAHSSFGHSNLIRHSSFVIRISPLALGICLCLSVANSLHADDDLDDILKSSTPAATAPVEPTAPQTQPSATLPDALGTMKPRPPAGARIGTITLSNNTKLEGQIYTPLQAPLRVWIDETKSYTDLDLALIKQIDVHVLSENMEDDWRWLKEGSDQKIFSGKKYPNLELAYKFTFPNDQTLEGTVVAEIDIFDGTKKHPLALYKKYHGKLDETLKDLIYIQSITLQPSATTTTQNDAKTTRLPLIY